MMEDALNELEENKSHPEMQQKIVVRLGNKLIDAKRNVVDRMVLEQCFHLYENGGCSRIQYELVTRVLPKIGAVEFVQKVLFCKNSDDNELSIALKEIIPTIEKLIEDSPHLFFEQADAMISKIRYPDVCRSKKE